MENTQAQLNVLALHLSHEHESILDAWRALAESDDTLSPSSHLTRTQFINHIPRILDALCNRFRFWPEDDTPQQRQLELDAVKSHSQHRWQMGYNMRALVRDWGHLNVCLLQELDSYGRLNPDLQAVVLPQARQVWAQVVNDSIAQSAVEYHDLLQIEATTRLNDLEIVVEHLHQMELARGHHLRTATHDLKGSLTVLKSAAAMVGNEHLKPTDRAHTCQILGRGIEALHQMLEELMDMARLEAGQDPRTITSFDAGQILTELCAASQPVAAARGLFLKADGPVELHVEGDLVKTRRIAQNLLLNALKYTTKGGVSVTWKEHKSTQWLLCVRDSGPGLEAGGAAPLSQSQGEGIGLSIVKRLCELLDARIEVETKAGVGTTFQVFFPLHPDAESPHLGSLN
jgi:signal transduction histidine kinase